MASPTNRVRVIVVAASGCCARELSAVATARPSPSAGPILPRAIVRPAVVVAGDQFAAAILGRLATSQPACRQRAHRRRPAHPERVVFGCAGRSAFDRPRSRRRRVSAGSAFSSGSLLPSPVLQAMGVPDEVLRSAMRSSFAPGQWATKSGEPPLLPRRFGTCEDSGVGCRVSGIGTEIENRTLFPIPETRYPTHPPRHAKPDTISPIHSRRAAHGRRNADTSSRCRSTRGSTW